MKNYKIKTYSKINLNLRVIKKTSAGYHDILSLITFCELHDVILISKIKGQKDKISFTGKFKSGINYKNNTITHLLNLLREKKLIPNINFKINIKKNIPHGSGLGGGSANAAGLLNYLNYKFKLNLKKREVIELARKIGFDVPISLERKNTLLTGKKEAKLRLKKKFNFFLVIVYPYLVCSTKKIYKKYRVINSVRLQSYLKIKNKRQLINLLIKDKNDLQDTAIGIYPKIKKIIDFINFQKGCYFSRITGTGSACFGIFSNKTHAVNALKSIKLKFPKYWCILSKTI